MSHSRSSVVMTSSRVPVSEGAVYPQNGSLWRVGTAITLGVETHPPVSTVRTARSRKPVDALRQPRRCLAKPRAARTSWPRWRARATRRNSSSAPREPLPGPVSREAGRVGRARALLDDLVDSQEKRLRNGDPEGTGRLEVDDESEARRLLDGEVRGPGPFDDAVNVSGNILTDLHVVRSVGEERPLFHQRIAMVPERDLVL